MDIDILPFSRRSTYYSAVLYDYDLMLLGHLASKLFIGGLNWDTTDGILHFTYHLRYLTLIIIIVCPLSISLFLEQKV
jgi:hypothetical protein